MKNWYQIKNLTAASASISIHDEIGGLGISASQFINELQALNNVATIELHIHSPGGSLLDGLAIYNALKNHPARVLGHVDGLAASAASVILMAGDVITMPEDAFLMIHNAQGGAYGDAAELRDMADLMEKLQSSAIDIYQQRTGQDRQTIIDMMAKETWMNATEAKALGFCDQVLGRVGLAAKARSFDNHFQLSPLAGTADFSELNSMRDFERFFRDCHLSKSEASALCAKMKAIFARPAEQVGEEDQAFIARLEAFSAKLPKSILN
ncbi:Clp protease ClpP [Methylomonas sp. EFPC3]|uniref:head maturation protease, ClpP-related n=1 Tax=Methylomonas sp. EFPC3 TaxID=3021710 RepID=UPI002416C92A|nr:head maturation protease, ClpP-related [Methylomonas sp. EFPC3]WFP51225.1 Clp protease ClpP [Methylomonas sp. EFPC3]